jgi:glycerate dehydrogenase
MHIVFLDENTVTLDDIDFSSLQALGSYTGFADSSEDEIIERAKDAEVIIANKAPITRNVLNKLPKLKLVTVVATGYNNVDAKAAKEKGVRVCNVPGYATNSVAQHTFALILNLAIKAYVYHNDVQAGKWQSATSFNLLTYPTFDLAGKTIGIIGFGAIGREVAKIAEAFGMKVLVNDVAEIKDDKYLNTDLDELLKQSDIVTLHCPLTQDNHNLIDAAALSGMKRTSLLINTARGGLVDEQALSEALNSGQITGAGVDVLSQEPPKTGSLLIDAKNIIVTPHSAWSTFEARQRLIDETARNIKAFMQGQSRNVVA